MRWRSLACLGALLSMVAACRSGGDDQVAPNGGPAAVPDRTGTMPSSATTPRDEEDAVQSVLHGFVRSTVTVNDPPDPRHPDLARYRTGAVLENAIADVGRNLALGIAYRWGPTTGWSRGALRSIEHDTAVADNCVVDGAQQVAVSDGTVLNDRVATKSFRTILHRVEGTWKVAENTLVERWEGVAGCAASS